MLALWDSFKPASGAPPWIASRARASQNVEARPLLAQFHELTSSFLGVVALHLSFVPADEVFGFVPGKAGVARALSKHYRAWVLAVDFCHGEGHRPLRPAAPGPVVLPYQSCGAFWGMRYRGCS